jgi:SAM-dependent methyltransferase
MIRTIKKVYKKMFPDLAGYLEQELEEAKTVLDAGCGNTTPLRYVKKTFESTAIDIYKPYLEEMKKQRIHNHYIHADLTKHKLKKKYDTIILIDVIEHLPKKPAKKMIKHFVKQSNQKVIILTPSFFAHNPISDGNEYQAHVSAWTKNDLERLGFKVKGFGGWKILRQPGKGGAFRFNYYLMRLISDVTQIIFQFFPNQAAYFLAVNRKR